MAKSGSGSVLSNMLWKLGERGSVQVFQFVTQIVLARLLTPNDYGTLAIVIVFINLANVFVQSGLPSALIQKKQINEIDISSVFYASLFMGGFLIGIIWIASPYIAQFYADESIINYLRVSSFVLLLGAFNSVQLALISRNLNFKLNFYSSLGGIIVAAAVAIYMALHGFGVWALIANYVINIVVSSIILYVLNPWLPKLLFSFSVLKGHFSFGSKLMVANFISIIFTDLYALVIGKRYSKEWLGYYENGNRVPSAASNAMTVAVQSVLLPVMSKMQDNQEQLKQTMRSSVRMSSFILFPLMFLLCASADPLILFLLKDRWLMAVPFLQLSAVLYAFYPIHVTNLQAINALGRSDIFMYCEIKKKVVELVILFLTIWFNIYIMAAGRVLASLIALYINMNPNRKFLGYGFKAQIEDFAPSLIIALIVSAIVYPICLLSIHPVFILLMQYGIGLTLYILLSHKYNFEIYKYFLNKLNLNNRFSFRT